MEFAWLPRFPCVRVYHSSALVCTIFGASLVSLLMTERIWMPSVEVGLGFLGLAECAICAFANLCRDALCQL